MIRKHFSLARCFDTVIKKSTKDDYHECIIVKKIRAPAQI